jgi:penicillin-binding protein 2
VAVIAENGGHGGSIAAPIAGKVIKQYLESDNEN